MVRSTIVAALALFGLVATQGAQAQAQTTYEFRHNISEPLQVTTAPPPPPPECITATQADMINAYFEPYASVITVKEGAGASTPFSPLTAAQWCAVTSFVAAIGPTWPAFQAGLPAPVVAGSGVLWESAGEGGSITTYSIGY
jgi:hypothetical protein